MTDAYLVDGARTPHGAFLGALSDVPAIDLGERAVRGLLEIYDAEPDWVCLGNAVSAGLGQVPARQVVVNAGLAQETPATTVNEASGSGLRAITLAADRIDAGRLDRAVAGGMESMSNAPYLNTEMRRGRKHGDVRLIDSMIHDSLWDAGYDAHMGELTEELVERFGISRESQDEYALRSHENARKAIATGAFEAEIVPVETPDGTVDEDEGPRETDLDALSGLRPAFTTEGTITAGNASDLSDGAGCVLLAREGAVDADPLARVVDHAASYRDPKWFGMSVADAIEELLETNDLTVDDIDAFELNEAFAAQMIYTRDRLGIPDAKLNARGGAIALGHPIGASGGILATTLAYRMRDEGAGRGIVGMSVGGGGGLAVLLARP
jgi:acetyl-CoA C-acetyltransferase